MDGLLFSRRKSGSDFNRNSDELVHSYNVKRGKSEKGEGNCHCFLSDFPRQGRFRIISYYDDPSISHATFDLFGGLSKNKNIPLVIIRLKLLMN
jgi:hypothetical protein